MTRGVQRRFGRAAAVGAVASALLTAAAVSRALGDDVASPEGLAFFEAKIRPVLAARCYSCHAGSAQGKGGLKLDNRVRLRNGGSSGSPIDLEDPDSSVLLAALRYEGPSMPPSGKLPDSVIADFERWVRMGAPDPRGDAGPKVSPASSFDFAAARTAWAYTTPRSVDQPAVRDTSWPRNAIDHFVLARQEAVGVCPVPDAAPEACLRRVTFDLTGLPPTPSEVEAFVRVDSPSAREAIVDRLLASQAFGERWGRHWMDVARFAESTGSDKNFLVPQAWRYRDWVIDAFSTDMPYDRFIRLQVAGDLMPAPTPAELDANRIATGFLALQPKAVDERVRELFYLIELDEQIEVVGQGVLGLTVSCARCHDHKFDPIPTTDYYALAGVFRSSETRDGLINRLRSGGETEHLIAMATNRGEKAEEIHRAAAEAQSATKAWSERRQELTRLQQQALAAKVVAKAAGTDPARRPPLDEPTEDQIKAMDEEVRALAARQDEKKSALARLTAYTMLAGMADRPTPVDIPVRYRGELDLVGPVVPRGFLTLLAGPDDPRPGPRGSGRLELAAWLTRPDNPLTARVLVNRLWSKLFGVGIVATVDDFGSQGSGPSHPELLDDLAAQFVAGGWSMKSLVRSMVLSRTYALASCDDPSDLAADPQNTLLWRWNRRRLDAEAIRDAVLAASGRLERKRPVGSPAVLLGVQELNRRTTDQKPVTDFTPIEILPNVRSVYLPVVRNRPTEPMAAFDAADPNLIVGRRDATTSPSQGLFVLNSPFILEQAEALARGLLDGIPQDDRARIDRAFLTTVGRRPTARERSHVGGYLAAAIDAGDRVSASPACERRLAAWTGLAHSLMALPEFRTLD
jgi:hypothetical protein